MIDLIKGELDWHETINSNFHEINSDKTGILTTLDEHTTKLSQKTNKADILNYQNTKDSMYFGVFFTGDSLGNTVVESSYFYTTYDCKNFTRLKNKSEFLARDVSFTFYNGKFYLFRTVRDWSVLHEFDVLISENLSDWAEYKVRVGSATETYNAVWAPEFFKDDDGKMYILYCQQVAPKFIDEDGKERWDMRDYIVEIIDLENLEFGTPRKLNLDDNYSRIDPHVFKKDGIYYLYTKHDAKQNGVHYGTIEIWTSTDLFNWNIAKNTIESLDNGVYEAPMVIEYDNLYYLYIDDIGSSTENKNMYYCTSNDLINWSSPNQIISEIGMRHGFIQKVENNLQKEIIINYTKEAMLYKNTDNPYNFNSSVRCFESPNPKAISAKYVELFTLYQETFAKTVSIKFKVTDSAYYSFDSEINLAIMKGYTGDVTVANFKETEILSTSIANKLTLVDCGNKIIKLFLDVSSYTTPVLAVVSIIAFNHKHEVLELSNDTLVDTLPTGTQYFITGTSNYKITKLTYSVTCTANTMATITPNYSGITNYSLIYAFLIGITGSENNNTLTVVPITSTTNNLQTIVALKIMSTIDQTVTASIGVAYK